MTKIDTSPEAVEALLAECDELLNQTDSVKHSVYVLEERVKALLSERDALKAALAAQIELDAGIIDDMRRNPDFAGMGCDPIIEAIRNQPHDRTALDRMLANSRETALREAADEAYDADSFELANYGGNKIAERILALIDKGESHE